MHIPRIYIDTSVIGGCFDDEFAYWSNKLFDECIGGFKIAVISDITTSELEGAPEKVRNRIDDIPAKFIEKLDINEESQELAANYIKFKAISPKYLNDASHIAVSTVSKVDVLVSWNFHHIVNYRRINLYNSINMMFGYPLIEIRTPREVLNDDTENI